MLRAERGVGQPEIRTTNLSRRTKYMRATGGREDTDRGQEARVCPAARLHWEGAGAQGSRTPESPRTGRQWEEEVARLTNKSTRQLPADVRGDSCASAE